MTKQEIITRLNNTKAWSVTQFTHDLWTYIDITDRIKVGKHHFEWAIFKLGKNQGFHFAERYKDIPPTLVTQLLQLLNKGKKK